MHSLHELEERSQVLVETGEFEVAAVPVNALPRRNERAKTRGVDVVDLGEVGDDDAAAFSKRLLENRTDEQPVSDDNVRREWNDVTDSASRGAAK